MERFSATERPASGSRLFRCRRQVVRFGYEALFGKGHHHRRQVQRAEQLSSTAACEFCQDADRQPNERRYFEHTNGLEYGIHGRQYVQPTTLGRPKVDDKQQSLRHRNQ